ncbi:Ras association domain protein [Paragonimus heterotremus]|uniref:Ras association domain protein n=1 Tax=Paragonimus heterotremus TaxID=100268 RepID=A0A8J4TF49_9TREM|nr:Ras association domain protein [Paragonimus heterotremus]
MTICKTNIASQLTCLFYWPCQIPLVERRLGANEAPLLVQLNWAFEDREVRFILRDESKPMSAVRQQKALERQPGSLQNGNLKHKSNTNLAENADERSDGRGFARRWSSGSRKKKRHKHGTDGSLEQEDVVPDSTFTRTLSNPDEVLRRRRQQRIQNRMQQGPGMLGDEGTNTVKIYGDCLNQEIPYITLNLTFDDTAAKVVHWTLDKYGLSQRLAPQDFCLVQVNIPPRGERLPMDMERELTLHDQDSLLGIRAQLHHQRENVACIFQIRHRRANGPDGRRPPAPPPSKPRAPPTAFALPPPSRSRSVGPRAPSSLSLRIEADLFLVEVSGDPTHSEKPDGLVASLTALFDRTYPGPIKLGVIEKMVGPAPNILVDKNLHPDIRPVHCTFSAVLASTSGSRMRLPKSTLPGELEAMTQHALLVTPSLDGFAKPPGPAVVRVDGMRITGPMLVPLDGVIQLGKSLWLRFIQSDISDVGAVSPPQPSETPRLNTNVPRMENGSRSLATSKQHNVVAGSHSSLVNYATENTRGRAPNRIQPSNGESTPDELPLTIDLQDKALANKSSLLDRYVFLVDELLKAVNTDYQQLITRTRREGEKKSTVFTLSPAYSLYLTYRSCLKHLSSIHDLNPSEQEHTISYLTNYIATRVYESLPTPNREDVDQFDLIHLLIYWLANSSELLQFLKNDVDLCVSSLPEHQTQTLVGSNSSRSSLHACRQALHLLADAVDHCFHELRATMSTLLQPLLYCLIYPGDSDVQDDLRLDDKPLNPHSYHASLKDPVRMQAMMQLFSLLMLQVRRARLNASLTIQLFAQLFHILNAHIFNQVLINTEAKPRHVREDSNVWLTRVGATRLTRRLDRIKHWAQRHGLERAAECRLQRCAQACQLVLTDRSNLNAFYQFCMGLLALNSIQLEWLLAHLADPPPVPDDWIDLIVTGGKEVNDRAIVDEMEHYLSTSQQDVVTPEFQLTESKELPLPLLLPPDGYASDAVLTGTPSGLSEFLRPLVTKGLIHVRRNPTNTGQINSRPWTHYLRLRKHEETDKQPGGSTNRNSGISTVERHFHRGTDVSGESESDLSGSDSEDDGHPDHRSTTQRYKPRNPSVERPVHHQQRQHRSLPDLAMSEFDKLAREANVPVNTIQRFYLRKHNNSLGLSIVAAKAEGQNQYGIYVKEIVPGGAAARDGRLDTGDQILAIGSANLIGCAQSDAVAAITKQSRADEGVQLTVSQGAAKYHRILELIKPAANAIDSNEMPTVKPRHAAQPHNSNQNEIPVNFRPGEGQHKIGSTVQPPSTRMGLKPVSQPRYKGTNQNGAKSSSSHLLPRRENVGYNRQNGSLSRSTPSLNLAEVGVTNDESPMHLESTDVTLSDTRPTLEPKAYKNGRRTHEDGTRTGPKAKSYENNLSRFGDRQKDSYDPQPEQLDSEETLSSSSGSDMVHEEPARSSHGQTNVSKREQSNSRRPTPQRTIQPSTGLHGSRSQPNISKPAVNEQTERRSSLSIHPVPYQAGRRTNESASDELSSLESVSSERTPCSLHDSAEGEQPSAQRPPTGLAASNDSMNTSEEKRARHPPPPAAPSQKSRPSLFNEKARARSGSRYVSESELQTNSPKSNVTSDSPRPQSAMQKRLDGNGDMAHLPRGWRETNMDEIERIDSPFRWSAKNHGPRASSTDTMSDGAHRVPNHNRQSSLGTPGTSESVTPTSADTVIPKEFPVTTQKTAAIHSKPHSGTFQEYHMNGKTENPLSPSIADVSHPGRVTSTPPPVMVDDTVSETLKPPPHAIISGPRWSDDRMPSFAPELLPDLPVLHNDPQRGRMKHGTLESRASDRSVGEDLQPVSSLESNSQSLVHAEFVPGIRNYQDPYSSAPSAQSVPFNAQPRPAYPSVDSNPSGSRPSYASTSANRQPMAFETISQSSRTTAPGSRENLASGMPTSLFASPPPTPTADCPQYHPPERLEPADWSSYKPTTTVNPEKTRTDRYERRSVAPQPAPKPHLPGSFSYHQPPLSSGTIPLQASKAHENVSHSMVTTGRQTPVLPIHSSAQAVTSAAQRVAQLEAEIATMENKRSAGDISPTLDRLRVELQFQKRLAERESLRKNAEDNFASEECLKQNQLIWEQKRILAEKELEASQNRRLAELEKERRAMLARQEQKVKERSEWFEQHKERGEIRHSDGEDTNTGGHQVNTGMHSQNRNTPDEKVSDLYSGRYGRPRFEATKRGAQHGIQASHQPTQHRITPNVIESDWNRIASPADLLRAKKSVSFDKNLETISVYSPPVTPQDSFIENPPTGPPRSAGVIGQSFFSGNESTYTSMPTMPKSQSSSMLTKHSVEPSARPSNISPNPVPNAELLPFKEKMRLFAQQIGEEPPKERSRISNLQKQLLARPMDTGVSTWTNSTTSGYLR